MIIVLGSMLAAYGITLALYAGFGGATLAIVWQGMSKTFHISIGMASLIVALIMIVFVFFYDRSQLNIGTILYQLVYSFCVDLFADAHVYSSHLWLNAVIMILGVMLFSFFYRCIFYKIFFIYLICRAYKLRFYHSSQTT